MDATYKIAEHMTAAGPALGRPWHRGATTITNACMTTTRRLSVGAEASAFLGGDTYEQYRAMAYLQVRFLGK